MGPNTNDRELMRKLMLQRDGCGPFQFFPRRSRRAEGPDGSAQAAPGRASYANTAILLDTKGPEIRTGKLKDGKKVILENGAVLYPDHRGNRR